MRGGNLRRGFAALRRRLALMLSLLLMSSVGASSLCVTFGPAASAVATAAPFEVPVGDAPPAPETLLPVESDAAATTVEASAESVEAVAEEAEPAAEAEPAVKAAAMAGAVAAAAAAEASVQAKAAPKAAPSQSEQQLRKMARKTLPALAVFASGLAVQWSIAAITQGGARKVYKVKRVRPVVRRATAPIAAAAAAVAVAPVSSSSDSWLDRLVDRVLYWLRQKLKPDAA